MRAITVGDLRRLLDNYKDSQPIVVSMDAQTASFLADSVTEAVFVKSYGLDSTDGMLFYQKLTPELTQQGYCEEDLYNPAHDGEGVVAVVIKAQW